MEEWMYAMPKQQFV